MIDQEHIQEFIKLRAEGMSFDKISIKLSISKPTLIKLSKKYQVDIFNQKSLLVDKLREEYLVSTQSKLELLSKLRTRAKEEIEKRDFSDLSTDKLLKIVTDTTSEINKILRIEFKEDDFHAEPDNLFCSLIKSWEG